MSAAALRRRCERTGMRVLVFALILTAASATAQPFAPQTMRITGTIEQIDGDEVTIRAIEGGGTNAVHLTKSGRVFGVSRGSLSAITAGAFIGVGAVPEPDGTQRAVRVAVFADSLRGVGEGFRPWDRAPRGTMTNATVAETVKSVEGQVVIVKYKGGEKRIVIPPDARILAYVPGERSELKIGAAVAIVRAKRKLDGS